MFIHPQKVTESLLDFGEKKAKKTMLQLTILAFMAGIFLAVAGKLATTVGATVQNPSIKALLGAMLYPFGMIMVMFLGAELFTSNTLMLVPLIEKRIKLSKMLKNWVIVYVFNFLGSLAIALLAVYAGTLDQFSSGGELVYHTIAKAESKMSEGFLELFFEGVICNFLVCTAVFMFLSSKSATAKYIGLFVPLTAFFLVGFEHCIANMYYGLAGIFAASKYNVNSTLTFFGYLYKNILPVTLGNIVGGGILALMLWAVYIYKGKGARTNGEAKSDETATETENEAANEKEAAATEIAAE